MATSTSKRWVSFSLRTLFGVVTLFAIFLGWFASTAQRQHRWVRRIEAAGGGVSFYTKNDNGRTIYLTAPGDPVDGITQTLCERIGPSYWATPYGIFLPEQPATELLENRLSGTNHSHTRCWHVGSSRRS